MSERMSKDFGAPPLGKMIDFNKRESDRLLALPFERIEEFETLHGAVEASNEEMNIFRKRFGLAELPLRRDDVRIVEPTVFDQDLDTKKYSEGGAFLHPINRTVFYRGTTELGNARTSDLTAASYGLTHEMTHRAMQNAGLARVLDNEKHDLFRLNEGLADWLAKSILNRRVLTKILSPERLLDRRAYLDKVNPEVEGIPLEETDVLFSTNDNSVTTFSYFPELKLVEFLAKAKPVLFGLILEKAFLGDRAGAYESIRLEFGDEMASMIADLRVSTVDILNELRKS